MGVFLLWLVILCVIIGSNLSREKKKNQDRNLNRPQQQRMPQQKMPEWLKNSGVYRPGTDTVRKAQPDIVVRAKINNDHFNEDDTLAEIEKMHGHKENEPPIRIEHEAVCMTHAADADAAFPQESIFGSAQDLIVKGYDGNMDFDRDFIAEAMEMINNCSY